MKHTQATELMHAVLDGEASAEESRALQRLLDGDADARAEFAALERLFKVLHAVPQQYPPEGLVAAVTAALPPEKKRHAVSRQLSAGSRVVRHASSDTPGAIRGDAVARQPAHRSEPPTRSNFMSQQHSGLFARRRTWIGAAIAAAAVVLVAQYGFDFPPRGEDVLGTIVPAQRYRAPQATATDVKIGGETATPSTPVPTAQADAANGTAQSAAQGAAQNAAQRAAQSAAQGAAQTAAQITAQSAAKNAAQNAAQITAQNAAQMTAQSAAKNAAESAAQITAQSAAHSAAQMAAQSAAQSAAKNAAQNAAQMTAQSAAQSAAQMAAQSAAQNAAQAAAKQAAQAAAQGAANGAVK